MLPSGKISPGKGAKQTNGVLQVVPRVQKGVGLLDLLRELIHSLDIVGDLADTKVARLGAGLMEVLGEGGSQFQERVVVPTDLDERAVRLCNVVKERIEHAPQLLDVNRQRTSLGRHGGSMSSSATDVRISWVLPHSVLDCGAMVPALMMR